MGGGWGYFAQFARDYGLCCLPVSKRGSGSGWSAAANEWKRFHIANRTAKRAWRTKAAAAIINTGVG